MAAAPPEDEEEDAEGNDTPVEPPAELLLKLPPFAVLLLLTPLAKVVVPPPTSPPFVSREERKADGKAGRTPTIGPLGAPVFIPTPAGVLAKAALGTAICWCCPCCCGSGNGTHWGGCWCWWGLSGRVKGPDTLPTPTTADDEDRGAETGVVTGAAHHCNRCSWLEYCEVPATSF